VLQRGDVAAAGREALVVVFELSGAEREGLDLVGVGLDGVLELADLGGVFAA